MRYSQFILILVCLTGLSNAASATTEKANNERSSTSSPVAAENIAKGEELLKRSCEFYRTLDRFSAHLTTDVSLKKEGKTTHKVNSVSCDFKRSNYLKIKVLKPKKGAEVVLNGLNAHFYNPKWQTYANQTLASPEQIYKEQDFTIVTDGALGETLIQSLTSADPYSEIMKNRTLKSYDGLTVVDGKKCHQLRLNTKGMSCDSLVWLSAGSKPWVTQFMAVRDCPLKILPAPAQPTPTTELSLSAVYGKMRDNPQLKTTDFKPPAGAQLVSHFGGSSEQDARQALVGLAAPEVKVRTAGDDKFLLSKQRGKVVVMEFWATWCPPCCRALPILEAVTESFSKSDVVFIAVNEKEEQDKVKSFLSEKSLNVRVGFDADGEVSQRYRVVGIPQTVVIGRDGKIKSIHTGLTPDFKEQMTKELQSML